MWLGIALCLSQSAMFSGLNLVVFSLSRLRLEAAAAAAAGAWGRPRAASSPAPTCSAACCRIARPI